LYRNYEKATSGAIPVIPDVYPGVNTFAISCATWPSRVWIGAPLVFVTSWNEWNEDTTIEPLSGQPTSLDDSPSGRDYTQGYLYGGEGDTALAAIRDVTAVAWGMVIGHDGTPAVHAELLARTPNGTTVAITQTDGRGTYVLPRTVATPAGSISH
jgi:hypothetical protein